MPLPAAGVQVLLTLFHFVAAGAYVGFDVHVAAESAIAIDATSATVSQCVR